MDPVSSTSSANQGSQQFRLQEAKRNADAAELTAQTLRGQANDAQRAADAAQGNARALAVQSDQAQANAGQARQGLATLSSAQQVGTQLSKIADQVLASAQTSAATTQSTSPSPVVNSQGQVTGTIVNTTA